MNGIFKPRFRLVLTDASQNLEQKDQLGKNRPWSCFKTGTGQPLPRQLNWQVIGAALELQMGRFELCDSQQTLQRCFQRLVQVRLTSPKLNPLSVFSLSNPGLTNEKPDLLFLAMAPCVTCSKPLNGHKSHSCYGGHFYFTCLADAMRARNVSSFTLGTFSKLIFAVPKLGKQTRLATV